MIELCIPLYGPACDSLQTEGDAINPDKIENLGFFLMFHLNRVAYTVKCLQNSGWVLSNICEKYILVYTHDLVKDIEAAEKELTKLDIPPDIVEVYEINDN